MVVLEIERLHVRYGAGADPAVLDPVLQRVAATGLAEALQREPLPEAWAVCVRTLRVPVRLDVEAPSAGVARAWAAVILAALRARLASSETAGHGDDDVVVYRCELDAVLELVRGVAAHRTHRAWAWRQVGLVTDGTTPGRAAVAVALGERPHLVPAVAAALPVEIRRALDAAGWVHVAERVAAAAGRSGRLVAEPAGRPHRAPVPSLAPVVRRARQALPAAAWDAASSAGAGPTRQQLALAVLALLLTAPARAADAALVASVAGAEPALEPDAGEPVQGAAEEAVVETTEVVERECVDPEVTTARESEPVTTAWGGVLYLVHAVTAVELPVDDPDLLAHALAGATGVPVDDPVVGVVARLPEPRPRRLTEPEAERAAAQARVLRAWTVDRLQEDDGADLDWVWQRRAVLDVRPGWVEAELRLADVDVRIRRAGLDLDPGFVWWLGSVVRFRHA